MHKIPILLAGLAAIVLVPSVTLPAQAEGTLKSSTELYVIPHEDDEFEMWSQLENDADSYKILAITARGEQTAFCDGYQYGIQLDKGEVAPNRIPDGRFKYNCQSARIWSTLNFLTDMNKVDATVPATFSTPVTYTLPANGANICRKDDLNADLGPCTVSDTSVEVRIDTAGRGALLIFNMGEGDINAPEVSWMVKSILANQAKLGIQAPPVSAIYGGYANVANPDCFIYANPDHVAVHEALLSLNFGVKVQEVASCGTDLGIVEHKRVSDASLAAAFAVGPNDTRLGAHVKRYGWLDQTYYHLDWTGQQQIFQAEQYFKSATK